ncbi:N-acylneuraminate cytidylyltransferase [Halyomorpha halys]|uniref:N-acylneuraminate cytidylyltransferase n=1 Tax=Halyomorpha halys TaxID=286706 RepID=UPI0006D520DE|nr:N-acylneuraminate cytidylyltransferase [Halyomorpha halys]
MRNSSGRFLIWLIFGFFIFTIFSIYFAHIFDIQQEPLIQELNSSSTNFPHFAGLVLARGGSKGIPHKNVAKIKNITLLARALHTMSEFGKFDTIWVSTDDIVIATEAKKGKAQVHWRASYTATDSASSVLAVKEFLETHDEVTKIGLIQCTSPFLKAEFLEEAYKMLNNNIDSVFSVTRQHKLRWGYNSSGQLQPENFDLYHRPRRQDWDGELIENGMFYFTDASLVKKSMILQGGKLGVVEIPANLSLEIDNFNDLDVAEMLMNSYEES